MAVPGAARLVERHGETPPELKNTFFVWEHTDFTKPDAVAYNLDSLARKTGYIESKFGKLALLQKSSHLVSGEPYYSVESFYGFVLGDLH